MSDRAIAPNCAWAMKETDRRHLPPDLSWLIARIAERVNRNTLQWWSSLEAMMADTRYSRRKVQYLIPKLPKDLIEARRGKDARWVFTLLRPALETTDPEAADIVGGAQFAPPDPARGAQPAPYPLKERTLEEKEEDARARREFQIQAFEEHGTGHRGPFPEGFELPPEVAREIEEETGHTSDDLCAAVAEWGAEKRARSGNWIRTCWNWARRTPPRKRRRLAAKPKPAVPPLAPYQHPAPVCTDAPPLCTDVPPHLMELWGKDGSKQASLAALARPDVMEPKPQAEELTVSEADVVRQLAALGFDGREAVPALTPEPRRLTAPRVTSNRETDLLAMMRKRHSPGTVPSLKPREAGAPP